jgi:hypothetical protein
VDIRQHQKQSRPGALQCPVSAAFVRIDNDHPELADYRVGEHCSTAKANSGTPTIKITAARSCSSHRHSRRVTSRNPGFGLMSWALSARPPIQVGAHAEANLRHFVDRVRADRERAQVEIAGGAPACIFAFGVMSFTSAAMRLMFRNP